MEEFTGVELFALAFNTGIVFALVQVLKRYVAPVLKTSYPWAIPIIALGIGSASSLLMARYGIDISPLMGAFTGAAASTAFVVIKEGTGVG